MSRPRSRCYVRRSGRSAAPLVQLDSTSPPPRRPSARPCPTPISPHAWRRIRAELRRAVTEATWDLWLEPLSCRELDGDDARRRGAGRRRAWVAGRFGRLLQAAPPPCSAPTRASSSSPPASAATAPRADARGRAPPRRAGASTRAYTFDQFVIGDANRLAHAAALAVAELPGLAYNPLFICGPPGLGKTHLLHSIAQLRARARRRPDRPLHDRRGVHQPLRRRAPRRRASRRSRPPTATSTSCSSTTSSSSQSKARTEEEFFHTFNALHDAGAQLVLTSDRLPRDLDALEDRLRERFEAGLVADIRAARRRHPPDDPAQARRSRTASATSTRPRSS